MARNYNSLSEEQQELINRAKNGENVLVDACIGSGKTTAIQALCDTLDNKSILYLTYNRLLKVDAKEKITRRGVFVQNYHGFASYCLWKSGTSAGVSDLIQSFNKRKPNMPKFDILVIDEYQDIEQELAEMLEHIKEENPYIQIIAVGDMKQKIYDKTTLDVPKFMNKFLGKHTLMQFTKCFRLNKDLAGKLGRIWDKKIIGVNENCTVETMDASEIVEFLSRQNTEDILCLGARTGLMSRTLNKLETKFPEKFNKSTVYASISDDNKGNISPNNDSAIFTTFDSSKGLERKICVVFDYTSDYWNTRLSKPMVDYEIMKNIFCVASSRGKEHIIFVKERNKDFLEEKEISTPSTMRKEFKKPFNMSDMFSFKYKEDVEDCFKLIKVKNLETTADAIEVQSNDCLIDLAPCIGTYQEAMFFKYYNIDNEIEFAKASQDIPNFPIYTIQESDTLEDKILLLTAIETTFIRYRTQVKGSYITDEQDGMIYERLKTMFDPYEKVQEDCNLDCLDRHGEIIKIKGRADVVKDGVVYELKFVQEITHDHCLQAMCYAIALGHKKAVVWNTRDNTMLELSIRKKDRELFLDNIIRTITKGVVQKYIPAYR